MFDSLALVFQPLASKQFDLLLVVYLVAITAEAMSGALAAGRRNMDFFGVAVIAFVTAWGAEPSGTSFSAIFLSAGRNIQNTCIWSFWQGWPQRCSPDSCIT